MSNGRTMGTNGDDTERTNGAPGTGSSGTGRTNDALPQESKDIQAAADDRPPIDVDNIHLVDQLSEEDWLKYVYRGDKVPQLTFRAVVMGAALGSLMSISNLYTSIKLGWGFGVAITCCVLSFVIWNGLRMIFPKLTPMTILENNCMQSTASAAGYSTGATVGTAFGALLLITGVHTDWKILATWTVVTACLGVFLAVPLKRQMINREKLPFPSGIAAAETLKSLYGQSVSAIRQAHALVVSLVVGLVVGFLREGEFGWQMACKLKIPPLIPFGGTISGVKLASLPRFGFEPSVLLIAAGMIVGMRVSLSMLLGSLLLYLVVGPRVLAMPHEIPSPDKLVKGWSLWTGTALMVTSGLTAFGLQWRTIGRALSSIKFVSRSQGNAAPGSDIEVPARWLVIGLLPLVAAMAIIEWAAFSIAFPIGILTVVMSFFLALVACRATGETDITPIGAMGKLTQLTYAVICPADIKSNLMAGSVTANIAASSSDLLTDLKSGYLLGANPRQQFLAQLIGVFFGLSVVPAWYAMVPDRQVLDAFNPPSTNMWRAVAEALSKGIDAVPYWARWGLLIGGVLGILLAVLDAYAPAKVKRYIPSAMGLGLSWVMPFANCLSFFIGALIALLWAKLSKKSAELYVVPVASGGIAGESLMSAFIAMLTAASALHTR